MDGRIDHFSYLIEEVESDFFQKTAEEIASESHVSKEPVESFEKISMEQAIVDAGAAGYEHDERSVKLAMLSYQSNAQGLTKQASEMLFDPERLNSYESILEGVSASSFFEPLGITKSALDYLGSLEYIGVDEEELDKLASVLLLDTMGADVVIEASLEKTAGDQRPVHEICDELTKLARVGVLKSIFSRLAKSPGPGPGSFSSAAGKNVRDLQRTAYENVQTAGREAKRLGGKVARGVQRVAGKPGKFERAGRAIAQRGIRDVVTAPFRRVGTAIKSGYRGVVGRMRSRGVKARGQHLTRLQKQRSDLQKQLESAKPGQEVAIGTRIQDVNKQISRAIERQKSVVQKQKAGRAAAGVLRPKAQAKTTTEATSTAQAKTGPSSTTGTKTDTAAKSGLKPGEVEEGARDLYRRGSRYGEGDRRIGSKYVGPKRERAPRKDTSPPPEKSPGPRPPKEDIEGKGMGVMDAWSKWGKDGWSALSDVEKSRLIRAGVMAGGGAAAYKTVFGD